MNELKNYGRKHHIDLLLISNEMNNHYCLIKDFSRLMNSSKSKHEHKKYYCRNCMRGYNSEEALSKHWPYCKEHSYVRIELPKEGTFMKFTKIERSMRVPFVVYADFESFIKPINTCDPDEKQSFTKQYQKHIPSSFCYYIKCFDDTVYKGEPVTYTAMSETDDVAGKFVEMFEKDIIEIYERTKFPKKMDMIDEDEKNYNDATKCHICKENLGNGKVQDHCHICKEILGNGEVQKTNKNHCHICKEIIGNRKVRDHCHLTGKYRGAAHNKCNIKYQIPEFIPILFHNLSGYDSHLFIKKLAYTMPGELTCIPSNEEKYISFSKEIKVDEYIVRAGILIV